MIKVTFFNSFCLIKKIKTVCSLNVLPTTVEQQNLLQKHMIFFLNRFRIHEDMVRQR